MLNSKVLCEEDSESCYGDSELETDSEFEDYQCVVCNLTFFGEQKFDQHRTITHHWG